MMFLPIPLPVMTTRNSLVCVCVFVFSGDIMKGDLDYRMGLHTDCGWMAAHAYMEWGVGTGAEQYRWAMLFHESMEQLSWGRVPY